jgi:cell wall-associated NlpC family hydrolase
MLDKRLNIFRSDLADERLRAEVEATRYVAGRPAQALLPVVSLHRAPDEHAAVDTQILRGETVQVFERANGWAWVQTESDFYCGYARQKGLGDAGTPTHRVVVPRTFVYPGPDRKKPMRAALSMGSLIDVREETENAGARYLVTRDGEAVFAGHCAPVDAIVEADYVSIAARFVETPYLWGGRSGFGIDCSALVQLSMLMTGRKVARDSDMQAQSLGERITPDALRRGDLVFWTGHVGIMEDAETLLHATGATMSVTRENLAAAIVRIRAESGDPTVYRRP